MHLSFSTPFLLITAALVLALATLGLYARERLYRRLAWGGALWLALTLGYLHSGDLPVLLNRLPTDPMARAAVQAYDTAWWVSLAWLAVAVLNVVLWRWLFPGARQPGGRKLVADLVSGFVYIAAFFAILSFAFDQEISGVLATSGVVAIVIGLALQTSLGEIVSGLFMSVEAPYHAGDWITIDDKIEGQVVETNWRATRIKVRTGDIVIVPNSTVARAQIVNHYFPDRQHAAHVDVTVDARSPPDRVVTVLTAAALASPALRHETPPRVVVRELAQASITYRVTFTVDDFADAPALRSEVASRIWHHLAWAGIRLEGPPQATPGTAETAGERSTALERALARVGLLAPLSPEERAELAGRFRTQRIKAGSVVVQQGAGGDSLFLISEGVLVVRRRLESGLEAEVNRLGPGDYFGEMSLLTGAPRSASVVALCETCVHELAKTDLAPILNARPSLARELAAVLATRERGLADAERPPMRPPETESSYADRIAGWITAFFRSAA